VAGRVFRPTKESMKNRGLHRGGVSPVLNAAFAMDEGVNLA
jgi:hypothetical protein